MSTGRVAAVKVLIVDDSALIRAVVRTQLQDHGYVVFETDNGADALNACLAERPDVMILDIEMPGLDGRSVLAAMQADEQLACIPVIFLSGRSEQNDVVAGLEAGAHDYLSKPFKAGELIARVRGAARVKRLTDDLRANNAELAYLSRTDMLTGLPNRRHLEELLRSLMSQSARHKHSVGVVLVDVDRFKSVNDTLGHPAGDAVLREVASRLKSTLRLEDTIGRWGGEEFLALLPMTEQTGCVQAAERLRIAVAAAPVALPGEEAPNITISAGCAMTRGDIKDVLRRADAALYAAKMGGRNRVCVDEVISCVDLGDDGPLLAV